MSENNCRWGEEKSVYAQAHETKWQWNKEKSVYAQTPQKSDGAQEYTPGRKFEPNLDETENCKKFQKIMLTYWHLYVILQGASLWYGMFVYYAF